MSPLPLRRLAAVLAVAMLGANFAMAESAATSPEAPSNFYSLRGKLGRQANLLKKITPNVERMDLGRIVALKQFCERAIESMSKNGSANMETMQKLYEVVIGFRYSKDLFKVIESENNSAAIREIQVISAQIADTTGFDKSPYTKITASFARQLDKLTQELLKLPLGPEFEGLIVKIRKDLRPSLGRLIAVAESGDDAETFAKAPETVGLLGEMNPDLDRIMFGNKAFDIVLEIQGLIEFYRNFSKSGDALDVKPSAEVQK